MGYNILVDIPNEVVVCQAARNLTLLQRQIITFVADRYQAMLAYAGGVVTALLGSLHILWAT